MQESSNPLTSTKYPKFPGVVVPGLPGDDQFFTDGGFPSPE
jgi:hypothetical protein